MGPDGRRSRGRRSRALALGLLLLGSVLGGALASEEVPARTVSGSHRLVLRARVDGLYPGAVRPMRVVVRNRTGRAVRLVRLTRRTVEAAPGCPTSALRTRKPRALPMIPADGRRPVLLRVSLQRSAPDACQGVVFRLKFRVWGVPA